MRVRVNYAVATTTSIKAGRSYIIRVTREIEALARINAARGSYATGALATQVKRRGPVVTPGKVSGQVGVWTLVYAGAVERGAKPHMIFPRGDYPLKFFWRKIGLTVRLAQVSHPGQRAKHFLTDALKDVGHRHRMRVVIYKR